MNARKASVRVLSLLLVLCMVVGLLPVSVFAAEADDTLTASLEEAKTYIDALTINKSSNDPETVVKNYGTHFTWDNEKRESSRSYLYDWSYYNGVVFEGLEYVYEVTNEEAYKDYVIEYLSSMITSSGTWAACSNNSSKECAGYVAYHGADCYKTASLLLDAYEMTNDSRYLTMAATLYADLDTAAESYLLSNAGNNYHHTWASASSPNLWLDGLYMILPFRAEYAKYIGDTEELDLIVERLQWVSDNMYDSATGYFYHAANSASSNSGTFWLRSIGWYAAAIVDVMDSMEVENLETMKAQLVKLVDGMKATQNASNGMWLNNLAASQSSSNPYETSGTALIAYAVMKAVNNGWLDESYADMAILAFNGICSEKLSNNTLTDICFKGAPGSSNSTFYDNEGKGVGPFIMLYAEILEYTTKETKTVRSVTLNEGNGAAYVVGDAGILFQLFVYYSDNSTGTVTQDECEIVSVENALTGEAVEYATAMQTPGAYAATVSYQGVTCGTKVYFTVNEGGDSSHDLLDLVINGATVTGNVTNVTEDVAEAMAAVSGLTDYVAYDITATLAEGATAQVSIPVPAAWTVGELKVIYITDDGVISDEVIEGTYDEQNGVYTFTAKHFSTYALVNEAAPTAETDSNSKSGEGYLPGATTYTYTQATDITAGKEYVIVANDTAIALMDNNSSLDSQSVTISSSTMTSTTALTEWTFSSKSKGTIYNGTRYLRYSNSAFELSTSSSNLSITDNGSNFRIYASSGWNTYSFYYDGSAWTRDNNPQYVRLYQLTDTETTTGATVTFTVTPGSTTLMPKGTAALTGTVTVAGETVDLSNCTITWASSATDKATVANGVVTGVADGSANITATLSAVNGTALQENIVLTIPVTVQSKAVTSGTVSGGPISVVCGNDPDYSGVVLNVTYDDGTTGTIDASQLTFSTVDTSLPGAYTATVSYGGTVYGTVIVKAYISYDGLDEATSYPEYPEDGAVRIDKTVTELDFEDTGVVEVELDVAGVSVKSAVDVILVADISNSMGWKVGEKTYPEDGENSKWDVLQSSAKSFVDILLAANDDGSDTDNTVSFVIFGGYDADRMAENGKNDTYFDATQTVFYGVSDIATAKAGIDKYDIRRDVSTTESYTLTIDGVESSLTPQGGTNYDHAFLEAAAAIEQLKAAYASENGVSYDESGRQIYIVFMTDGAPDHYNQFYYKNRSNTQFDYYALYVNSADITRDFSNYLTSTPTVSGVSNIVQHTTNGYYMPNSTAITEASVWSNWILSSSNAIAEQVLNISGVNSITSVGFDLSNGGFGSMTFDSTTLETVLGNLAGTNSCEVKLANNADELNEFYKSLATKIRYAGTSAQVTDVINSEFTLQTAAVSGTGTLQADLSEHGITPAITIKAYELWTKEETSDTSLIGTRKTNEDGSYVYTEIEIVTFSDDGKEAYSNLLGEDNNIMTINEDGSVIIAAKYFTYTKTADGVESFSWTIGNITDKEIALSFMAYLQGSLEGTKPKGLKYTNEEAYLEYIDINGDYAKQTFPVPAVAWGGASTAYEFYLVNENGEPCDRNGNVVPFANRVIITGPYYEELYLNQEGEYEAVEIIAAYVLPVGYTLYDETATYTVITANGNIEGSLTISDPADGKAQTTILVSATTPSYIQSRVAFGVLYNDIPTSADFELTPDEVVIDYGKHIVVDITNEDLEDGYTATLVGFTKYYASVDMKTKFSSTSAIDNFKASYGTFSIENDGSDGNASTVRYTPTAMVNGVETVFCVIKMHNASSNDTYYMADKLTVIPATIMYYETNFADGVFTTAGTWNTVSDGSEDGPQDCVKIGTDLYGYDSSYTNDSKLSNGTSWFTNGEGVTKTVTEFTFTGTGFDLISRTGAAQGLIKVQVYASSDLTTAVKTISVLNKSESSLELYQIPVVSINDLPYGSYYVNIGVDTAYTNNTGIAALDSLNRGNEFYFDAIRIYDPIDVSTITAADAPTDAEIALAAYIADGEAYYDLTEIRSMLLSTSEAPDGWIEEGYDDETDTVIEGVVFVDRNQSSVGISDYSTIGPNNEVYLTYGQTIAFIVNVEGNLPESIHIGAKSADGNAVQLGATVYADLESEDPVAEAEAEIATATSMFYDVLGGTSASEAFGDGNTLYVYITNLSDSGVLSITDLKVAYGSGIGTYSLISDTYLVNKTAVEEEETVVSNCDVISTEFTASSVKRNRKATLTVVTSADVESLAVTNSANTEMKITASYVINEDGNKVWTVSFTVTALGNQTYTVTGYGADGTSGAAASATIKVTR